METTGFCHEEPVYVWTGSTPFIVGPGSRIIERFTRISNAELDYTFTIKYPSIYKWPFRA